MIGAPLTGTGELLDRALSTIYDGAGERIVTIGVKNVAVIVEETLRAIKTRDARLGAACANGMAIPSPR